MTTPKVSVIVPVYNTEKYLERCMKSVLNQTLKEIEIIMVDDGSKEECAKLCDKFAAEDSRVRVIHKENGGLGFARNTGILESKGEYVGFVDSDDYIEPLMCEELYTSAVKNDADIASSGLCFVGGNMFSEDEECIKQRIFSDYTIFQGEDIKNLLLGVVGALPHEPEDTRYGVSVCKNIFKRSVIIENSIEFLSERKVMSEDALFMVDYIKCIKKAVGVPGAYYCYCRNEDSLSKSYREDRPVKTMFFLKELEDRIKDYVTYEEYGIYLNRLIQAYGRVLCSQEIMHARDKKIKYSALRKRLKAICESKEISDVLKTYPWYKLPLKQAVFAFTIKYKLFLLQKLIVSLRDR